jgi:hypothetical protein
MATAQTIGLNCGVTHCPELIVLVDFKAIYLGVPPGIFGSFPGVAHFLSFTEIANTLGYPRVKSQIPGVP